MRHRARAALLTCFSLLVGALACAGPASASASEEIVYVGSAGGAVLRVLDRGTGVDTVLPGSQLGTDPSEVWIAVSPDGRKVALLEYDSLDFGMRLSVYDRDTASIKALGHVGPDASYTGLDWMPDSQHLLVGPSLPDNRAPLDLELVGLDGSHRSLPGTKGIGGFSVSPSGLQLAYTGVTAGVPHVWLANLDGTGRVDLGVMGEAPLWSHDGSMLLASLTLKGPDGERVGRVLETFAPNGTGRTIHDATYASGFWTYQLSADGTHALIAQQGRLREISLATGAATQILETSYDAQYAAPWTATDTTPPHLTSGPLLAIEDSAVRFAWSNAAVRDSDIVGVQIALSRGLTPPATYAAAARRTTVLGRVYSTRFTALLPGATYSYSMWALDASGNVSAPRTGHVRLVPAVVSLTVPAVASTTSTGGWIRVGYSTTSTTSAGVILHADPGGRGSWAFSPGVQLGYSGVYYYGRGNYPETLEPGANYRMCLGTRDEWGNPHWTTTCLVSQYPLDDRDRHLAYAGSWSRFTTTGTWMGTTSATRTGGSAAFTYVYRQGNYAAKRFTVVASTFSTGGRFRVYVDGRYVTTVSTRTSRTLLRRAVWTSAALTARRTHSVRIVQVSGSGWLRLDAVSVLLQ